jgi:putative glycerol-1-phosphate prenyltransferase
MIDLISKTSIHTNCWWRNCRLLGINKAHDSGADLVVIGTAFERDFDFFDAKQQLIENK